MPEALPNSKSREFRTRNTVPVSSLMQDRHVRPVHRVIHAPPLALPFNADSTELRTALLPGKYLYAVRDYRPATLRTAASIRALEPSPSRLSSPTSMMLRQVAKQLVPRCGFHGEGGSSIFDEPALVSCAGFFALRCSCRCPRGCRRWPCPATHKACGVPKTHHR
jgi:hypothetical protein